MQPQQCKTEQWQHCKTAKPHRRCAVHPLQGASSEQFGRLIKRACRHNYIYKAFQNVSRLEDPRFQRVSRPPRCALKMRLCFQYSVALERCAFSPPRPETNQPPIYFSPPQEIKCHLLQRKMYALLYNYLVGGRITSQICNRLSLPRKSPHIEV